MTLIGIGGAARAGKDTVANVLVERFGYTKMGMSDLLNDALLTLDPLVNVTVPVKLPDGSTISNRTMHYSMLVKLVGYTEAKTVPDVRWLLQKLGTDVVRNMIDKDAWVKAMTRRILNLLRADRDARVVVSGIRFPNELDMIHSLNGHSVYIHCPDLQSLEHISEQAILPKDFNHRLSNDRTLPHLENEVLAFMEGELGMSAGEATIPSSRLEHMFEETSPNAKEHL